jgi:hypothetical protein
MEPELPKVLSISTKEGLQALSALTILLGGLAFSLVFIRPLVIPENMPLQLVTYVAFPVLAGVVMVLLDATDTLTRGDPKKNRYARAFQSYWPSRHLATKFKLTDEEAEYLWFYGLFNQWRDSDHPLHSQWVRTLQRGYACRFVYHCIVLTKFLGICAVLLLSLELLHRAFPGWSVLTLFTAQSGLGARISALLAMVAIYFSINYWNNPSPEKLSGAWRAYSEINRMHIKWIDKNIRSLEELEKLASSGAPRP